MMIELGKNERFIVVNCTGELPVVAYHLGMIGIDHSFPGAIVRVNGKFTYGDKPAAALSSLSVIGNMTVIESALGGKVCAVGKKTNTVGQRDPADPQRGEKMWKHFQISSNESVLVACNGKEEVS
jgi:hypothetical protein